MRRAILWLALSTLLVPAALLAPAPAGAASPEEDLASLAWLAGRWRGPVGDGTWEATYTTPEGDKILGMSKELGPEGLRLFEFERFEVVDGAVVLTPYPGGRTPAVWFTLTGYDPAVRRAAFENPEHDFPTRIVFASPEPDLLHIVVTGPAGDDGPGLRLELTRQP